MTTNILSHLKGAAGLLIMLTTLPISLPMLLLGATLPRTTLGALSWRSGNRLLNGWPIDGVTADDERRAAGLPVPSDEILGRRLRQPDPDRAAGEKA